MVRQHLPNRPLLVSLTLWLESAADFSPQGRVKMVIDVAFGMKPQVERRSRTKLQLKKRLCTRLSHSRQE
jgi:hypothetical protein